ncbi:MAG: hypothetical protein HZC28_10615 [Spirochaetes bacterium]|nr:hypothetical protein [Spirochaetota bacterium]
MTSRERLLTVLAGGIPDRVPATVHQWQGYHLKTAMGCSDDIDAFAMSGLDAVVYPSGCYKPLASPDWKTVSTAVKREDGNDEITTTVATPDGTLTKKSVRTYFTTTDTEHLLKKPEDIYLLDRYFPTPELDPALVAKRRDALGDNGICRMFTNGPQGSPWQDACSWYGTETMIYFAFDMPDWTHECMEILLRKKIEFYKKNIAPFKGMFSMIETGGGAASNTVISPDMFKEFCLPYDKRQHDILHDMDPNLKISYHTCGGMMKLLNLIPENGCDISETLSPVACGGDIRDNIDEVTVKNSLGSRVMLMGGVNQSQIIEDGSRDDIFRDVERAFNGYGKNGGYIMMPSDHFFHAPKENILSYAAAARAIGRYR